MIVLSIIINANQQLKIKYGNAQNKGASSGFCVVGLGLWTAW